MATGFEVTSMSSRGQVVIPLDIREQLGLKEGEKFFVIGEDDTILLKKMATPSFKDFDKLIKKASSFAREKSLKQADVDEAVKRARK
jgi:antitoxin PrlF